MYKRQVSVGPPVSPEPAVGEWTDFAMLPRRYRQVVDFLLLYPEFFDDLLAEGLEIVVKEPILVDFVKFLKGLRTEGNCTPEMIFSSLPEGEARKYAAQLFMDAGNGATGDETGSHDMCNELKSWLREEQRVLEEADLLQQIRVAQEAGDREKVMELLRRKQECGRKRTGFCDNLLKNE